MKILVINGSPRGKKSTTYMMVEAFLSGMRECGWKDDHILLSQMKIHHCMGCFHCWFNKGQCIFDDDMKKIPLRFEYDMLLLASPLFIDNVTGLMKNFLDRMAAGANPRMEHDAHHECRHIKKPQVPKLIAMSNCGFPEQSHFEVLKLLCRRLARNMGTELIAEIYRGGGSLLLNPELALQTVQEGYKALLQTAGREIATTGALSAETTRKLEEPLIPHEEYIKGHNAFFANA